MLIDGQWVTSTEVIDVRNPFDGRLVDTVPMGTTADVEAAVASAARAAHRPWPTHARYDVLMRAAARLEADQEAYARTIALEGSKTIVRPAASPSGA